MVERRRFTAALVVLAASVAITLGVPHASADLPGWAIDPVAPGIEHLRHERPSSLSVHAARVAPGAAVLRPIVAANAVGGNPGGPANGREHTSDLCRKGHGVICVNGDFFLCRTCGEAAGGLVVDGIPMRSFRPDLAQLSVVDGAVTTAPLGWSGRLRGEVRGTPFDVALAALNRGPIPDGISLYTPDWGPATPPDIPRVELVLAAGGRLAAGVRAVVPVARRDVAGPIPPDAVVLLGTGASAGILDHLWHLWTTGQKSHRRLVLDTALTAPATMSIGGHPALLRGGERLPLNGADPMVVQRHPRTLAGVTAGGDVLLVAVDGRQPGYSNGLTLHEAQDVLIELGAVEAINLDGGGSTTFVGWCGAQRCVRNRPSGGGERPVVSALALVAPPAPPAAAKELTARPAAAELPTTSTSAPQPTSTTVPRQAATTTAPAHVAGPAARAAEVAAPARPPASRPPAAAVAAPEAPDRTAAALLAALLAGLTGAAGVRLRPARPRTDAAAH